MFDWVVFISGIIANGPEWLEYKLHGPNNGAMGTVECQYIVQAATMETTLLTGCEGDETMS